MCLEQIVTGSLAMQPNDTCFRKYCGFSSVRASVPCERTSYVANRAKNALFSICLIDKRIVYIIKLTWTLSLVFYST